MTDTKPRRPKGAGAVRNRGTERQPRWFGYYSATIDGQRRQLSKGPFSRKADAERWLRDELKRKDEGRLTAPSQQTVADLLAEWIEHQHDLRANTAAEYRRIIDHRLVPHLGHVKVRELQPAHVRRMLTALRAPGANRRGKASKGLSGKSLQHSLGVLRSALQLAVRENRVAYNVADSVDRPKKDTPEMQAWTADELAAFLAATGDDRLHPLWHTAAFTGLRRGELLGLRWDDLDLDAATLDVRRTRVGVSDDHGNREIEAAPKTAKSRRTVDLDPTTVAVLRRWRAAQAAERLAWGPAWQDTGHVFTREDGAPVPADHVAGRFGRALRASGVPAIRFHDLRHTHATLLLQAGEPVHVVSARLGHASAAMVLTVYGHVLPRQQATAAASFAALVEAAR